MTNDYKQLAEELYETLKRVRYWGISNIVVDEVLQKYEQETTRGTGRTTSLYMKAIAEALENPGKSVEFVDHYPHRWDSAQHHAINMVNIIDKLGFDIAVTTEKTRVFLYNRFGQ
jgi:hypothetical protein